MTFSYDPNTQTFLPVNLPLGMSIGSADSTSQSLISSKNFQSAKSLSDSKGSLKSKAAPMPGNRYRHLSSPDHLARQNTQQKQDPREHQKPRLGGSTDTEYEPLPTSFHSKDNELYMKGEMIRNLPVGRAVIKFRSNTTFLNVPPPRKSR